MSSRDDRRDDRRRGGDADLEDRLDELEDVLTELRRDLRETERDRRGPPRPPSLSELVRFTERYTIPTIIALLETTIKSLELLQGTLRLADSGRRIGDETGASVDRLGEVRDGASAGLARSLSELRTALSEADLPEEAASRSIIADARDLTAEIESRIEESRREVDSARRGDRRETDRRTGSRGGRDSRDDAVDGDDAADSAETGGIQIDVTDPDDDRSDPTETADEVDDTPSPEVDVESELESIRRQVDGDDAEERDDVEGSDNGEEGNESDEADPDDGSDDDGSDDDPDGDARAA
ncbi:DUF7547 family protein [Halorubrum sp. DTA46]|uniref:DUF7547 family protein n=1 Tax=Halorubrum sp. DTA46 TaxID=3402162 RepID=UPI003AAC4DD4